jgi:hypothetical protein
VRRHPDLGVEGALAQLRHDDAIDAALLAAPSRYDPYEQPAAARAPGGRIGPRRITLDAGRTSIGSVAVKVKRGSTRYTVRVTDG